MKLLFITTWYRTRNNKRRTRIIYQYTVHFIHHSIVVFALHHLLRLVHHIIAQVVKTKFIVGAISNIRLIGLLPFKRIWLVFINAVNSEAKEFKYRPVPLLVTAS